MQATYLVLLMDTVPGDVTLEVFARKAGWTKPQMRAELMRNAPLAAYYTDVVRLAIKEVPA